MKDSKKGPSKVAEEIVGVFETHFAKLPSRERAKRERAFDKVLANVGSRAKSSTRIAPRVNQAPSPHP